MSSMNSSNALFINGIYDSVLEEILQVQGILPEQIMFLQPYSGRRIAQLRDSPPTVDEPMKLYLSTTEELATVRYQAEIVGWKDKTVLSRLERRVIDRLLWTLQPNEGGLYDKSTSETGSVNLLLIRRLEHLKRGFSVRHLIKVTGNEPVSSKRTTAGGWTYVKARRR
jgi:hypothetical protein